MAVVLLFEFFPMVVTIVITIAAIGLFISNWRTPHDPAEAEERRRRADERRERARDEPRTRGGGRRPSMSS